MRKAQHLLQLLDQWLKGFTGGEILDAESKQLSNLLKNIYGKQSVLIGAPSQLSLLQAAPMSKKILISPIYSRMPEKNFSSLEAELTELPIATASVDLVILPHVLEFHGHPRQVVSEACRIVKPEGNIIIFGFNPYSLWGLIKIFSNKNIMPWTGNFIPAKTVKNWLKLADFQLLKHTTIITRPLTIKFFKSLGFLEGINAITHFSFGGIYILMAQAKVMPLTPIKLRWKQELAGISIPTLTVPGTSIRNSNK